MPPLHVFHFADRPFLCFPLWSSGVLKGSKHKLVDGLSDLVLEKTGANLLGADNGVWLSMEPWTAHIFTIQKKAL
jgi:hypothetical protein